MRHLVTMIQIIYIPYQESDSETVPYKETDSDNEQYIDSPYMTKSDRLFKRKCPIDYEDL